MAADHRHHAENHGREPHALHSHYGHSGTGGDHTHAPVAFGRAFAIGTALNAGFVAVQVFYGLEARSTALLADAVHNFGDVLALVMAWGASILAVRGPSLARTYGWGRGTILASVTNAVVLLFGCGAIALEAGRRFFDPQQVVAGTIVWVAMLGIVVNGATAMMFMRGRKNDLNVRGAFLHMASDAAVSAAVVLTGLLIAITHWVWLDPATSLLIVAVITIGSWSLLRESLNLAMDAVPDGIDLAKVEEALRALPGVVEVHDLHVWGLSTTETAITAHLVQEPRGASDLVGRAAREMRERFAINHSTFQTETTEIAENCALRPAHIV